MPTDTEHSPIDPPNSDSAARYVSGHAASGHAAHGHAAHDPGETLPRPELNPLLNPLLGDNMGLWAEVYFRNPPENREQAVIELLKELKNKTQNSAASGPAASDPAPAYHTEDRAQDYAVVEPASPEQISLTRSSYLEPIQGFSEVHPPNKTVLASVCPQCGYERANQRFCGMCGTPLQGEQTPERSNEIPGTTDFSLIELTRAQRLAESLVPQDQDGNTVRRDRFESRLGQEFSTMRDRRGPEPDISGLLRSLGGESDERSRHRGYIVAGLAVVLLTLGYLGWRSSRTPGSALNGMVNAMQTSHSGPTPGSPTDQTTTDQATATPPQSPATAQTSIQNRSQESSDSTAGVSPADGADLGRSEKSAASASESETRKLTVDANAEKTNRPASIKEASLRKPENPAQVPGAAGSGSEELAMAEKYLNGSAAAKNDAEAAQWLWKAVSKRNLQATMLLADMYLRGNGIPKNCGQARILLDAAASRGAKDAAFRLRNIQSFGCQ